MHVCASSLPPVKHVCVAGCAVDEGLEAVDVTVAGAAALELAGFIVATFMS